MDKKRRRTEILLGLRDKVEDSDEDDDSDTQEAPPTHNAGAGASAAPQGAKSSGSKFTKFAGVDEPGDTVESLSKRLLVACAGSEMQEVQHCLDSGASLTVKDSNGVSPLHIASMIGDVSLVQALLKHQLASGEDISAVLSLESNMGWTPLQTAAVYGHTAVLKSFKEVLKENPLADTTWEDWDELLEDITQENEMPGLEFTEGDYLGSLPQTTLSEAKERRNAVREWLKTELNKS